MKLLRILLLLLLPAIAFSELPIIEPTLVEGEYNVYNKQSFMHHLEAEKSLIFYSENEDGNPTLFAYSDDLSEVKKIKEFESKFYTEINFVPTQLDIAIFYVIDTISDKCEFWRTDGTAIGTYKLDGANIPSKGLYKLTFKENNGYKSTEKNLLFLNNHESIGEYWITNGTKEGTNKLEVEIVPDNIPTGAIGLVGTEFIYSMHDTTENFYRIWSTDLETHTYLYKTVKNETVLFYEFNDLSFLYTSINLNNIYNRPLVVTDGTKDGTFDILEGKSKYLRFEPIIKNDDRVIIGAEAEDYYEIISTDGTIDGTLILAQTESSYEISTFSEFVDDKFLFYNHNTKSIYLSDQSQESVGIGTIENLSYIVDFKVIDDEVYIIAQLSSSEGHENRNQELWKYNFDNNKLTKLDYVESLHKSLEVYGKINNQLLVKYTYMEWVGTKSPHYSEFWLIDINNKSKRIIEITEEKDYNYSFELISNYKNSILFRGYLNHESRYDFYYMDKNLTLSKISVKNNDRIKKLEGHTDVSDDKYLLVASDGNSNKLYTLDKDLVISSVAQSHENITTTFPNPATNFLTIEGIENENVSIFNLDGELLLTERLNGSSIDVSELSAGVYFIIDSNGKFITKFVKE